MNKEEINIIVTDREGIEHALVAPTDMDLNVMELTKAADLPVEGTCGGMALCASCHVYVESSHELPAPSEDEEDMLDAAFFVEPSSRLCCQIKVSPAIDGLRVRLAPVD